DGMEEPVLDEQAGRIAEVCMAEGAPDLFPADTPEKQKFLWDMRRSIGELGPTPSLSMPTGTDESRKSSLLPVVK
ncbi:MAG: hypothetical protein AAB578_08485, partial [Elusimicrobiota bacterium]